MEENRGDTKKEAVTQSNPDRNKLEMRIAAQEKSDSIPNPVKGLMLSLYPMIKEH